MHGICPKRRNEKDQSYNRKCLRVSLQKWEPDSHFWNSLFLRLLRYVREPDVLALALRLISCLSSYWRGNTGGPSLVTSDLGRLRLLDNAISMNARETLKTLKGVV